MNVGKSMCFILFLCLVLTGCSGQNARQEGFVHPSSGSVKASIPAEETSAAATETPITSSPSSSFTADQTPSASFTADRTPPVSSAPATAPPTAPGVTQSPLFSVPETAPGVNIRHEGFGGNASKIIVLDPGHQRTGMSEKEPNSPATDVMKAKVSSGTQGVVTHIPEYELNLAVSLYVRDALLAKGYTVIMTHEVADVSISNIERTEIANDAHASVLLHIHANAVAESGVRGAMTICQTKSNPACGEIYEESYRLAKLLLDTYCAETGLEKDYVWKTDTMTGINWSRVPVATLELGYMSNAEEDLLMAQDLFRQKAATAIAHALETFLND